MAYTERIGAPTPASEQVETSFGGPAPEEVPTGPLWVIRDSFTEATRHIRAVPRNPDLLVFAAIQPVMFVLLFRYVFGGSITVEGYARYEQYLLPGIFAQTVLFGTSFTAVGLAEDLTKGFIDRLRSLPMSQSAVLIGRSVSDLMRNIFTFVVMFLVAYAVGFRVEGSIAGAIAATLLLLAFSYAFSWIQAFVGLSSGSVEAANSASFIWMFPLTFVSSAFVDTRSMPGWLEGVANVNPFTVVTNATRALYNGHSPGSDVWVALAWAVGITAVFSLLSMRKFNSAASR